MFRFIAHCAIGRKQFCRKVNRGPTERRIARTYAPRRGAEQRIEQLTFNVVDGFHGIAVDLAQMQSLR
jgi:hypothetical protein